MLQWPSHPHHCGPQPEHLLLLLLRRGVKYSRIHVSTLVVVGRSACTPGLSCRLCSGQAIGSSTSYLVPHRHWNCRMARLAALSKIFRCSGPAGWIRIRVPPFEQPRTFGRATHWTFHISYPYPGKPPGARELEAFGMTPNPWP